MPKIDGTTTTLDETSRTYIFPEGQVTFEDVIELTTRPSGTHRLKTSDGQLHIVKSTWIAISIVDKTNDWTV